MWPYPFECLLGLLQVVSVQVLQEGNAEEDDVHNDERITDPLQTSLMEDASEQDAEEESVHDVRDRPLQRILSSIRMDGALS